jgi:predicted RNA binding protein YcfA (HicA-like mRNA interferase family)
VTVKVRDIIREVETQGWVLDRQHGSHRQYTHPTLGGIVTIAGQPGADILIGTLKSIRKQAQGTPPKETG